MGRQPWAKALVIVGFAAGAVPKRADDGFLLPMLGVVGAAVGRLTSPNPSHTLDFGLLSKGLKKGRSLCKLRLSKPFHNKEAPQ